MRVCVCVCDACVCVCVFTEQLRDPMHQTSTRHRRPEAACGKCEDEADSGNEGRGQLTGPGKCKPHVAICFVSSCSATAVKSAC